MSPSAEIALHRRRELARRLHRETEQRIALRLQVEHCRRAIAALDVRLARFAKVSEVGALIDRLYAVIANLERALDELLPPVL